MTLPHLSRRRTVVQPRTSRLRRRLEHLVALCWWSLRLHVAERHHLPRSAVGPPPRLDGRQRSATL